MKTAWALGAAFVAVVLVLVVFSVLATEMGSAERLSSTETLEGIDVPVIGTVGDFPDPAHRVVVNVTADGTIVVDGSNYTMTALVAELKRRGELVRGEQVLGTNPPKYLSDASAVLRIDGNLPWGSTQRLVEGCSEAFIWRISFAVAHDRNGAPGALGFPLPRLDESVEQHYGWNEFSAVAGAGGGSPAALHEAAAKAFANAPASLAGKLGVRLRVDPVLPTRVALELIDAAIRADAKGLTLVATQPTTACDYADFDAEVARLRSGSTSYTLRRCGVKLVDPCMAMPGVPRVRGVASVPSLRISLETR